MKARNLDRSGQEDSLAIHYLESPTRWDMFRHGLVVEEQEAGFEDVKKSSYASGLLQVVVGGTHAHSELRAMSASMSLRFGPSNG